MTSSPAFVARSPEDVLAVVPVVLGFVPADSVVMLTFGAAQPFHARVDLPPSRAEIPDVVEALLAPARRHRVRRVVLVLYAADDGLAKPLARALARAFGRSGVDVIDALRADGRRWFALLPGRRGVPEWGVPYDVTAHPFAARAVVEGLVTHRSRGELGASLARDPERVGALAAAVAALPAERDQWAVEAAWVRSTVGRHVAAGSLADDAEAARLLGLLGNLLFRDVAWSLMGRDDARDHVGFWTDLVRRSPPDLLPAPAALLAFSAWLAGHGALAWCGVDACLEADPGYGLADIVSHLLIHAVPPSVWEHEVGWADVFDPPA